MKKWTKKVSAILLCLALSMQGVACKPNSSNPDEQPQAQVEESVKIDKTDITILLGATEKLTAICEGGLDDGVEWTSSNESVATVADGTVKALGVGTTTIEAVYGDKKATCKVTVTLGEFIPVLDFEDAWETNINIAKNEYVNMKASVLFNGQSYDDATFEYVYSDKSVGEVDENGMFIPKRGGNTFVTVIATWRGVTATTLRKTFEINVISNLRYSINGKTDDKYSLYTVASHGGRNYETQMPFVIDIVEDGRVITPVVNVISGADCISMTNETVTAQSYGTATVEIKFTTASAGVQTRTVEIEVKRPVAQYETKVTEFSALDGVSKNLAWNEVFGANPTLVSATDADGNELTVQDNKVLGLETRNNGLTQTSFTAYTATVGYEFTDVEAVTKIIDDAQDLDSLKATSGTVDGYFVLANDVGSESAYYATATTDSIASSFVGTFEGNGHAVYARTSANGLFGNLGTNAMVKNVQINVDVNGTGASSTILAGSVNATASEQAKVQDVYVKVSKKSNAETGALLTNQTLTADVLNLQNVIFDVTHLGVSTENNYGLVHTDSAMNVKKSFNDVYVLTANDTINYSKGSSAGTSYAWYGANQTVGTVSGVNNVGQYEGVFSYATYAEFNNRVRTVGDWTVLNGGISWQATPQALSTTVGEYSETLEFSTANGQLPMSDIFGAGAHLVSATSDDGALEVRNGRLYGIALNRDSITNVTVTLYTKSEAKTVRLAAATKYIETADDFKALKGDETTDVISGYYVLKNDIGSTTSRVTTTTAQSTFAGTLDGNGHTVYVKIQSYGMLGTLGENATIKNIKLDTTFSKPGTLKYGYLFASGVSATANNKAKIENVYITSDATQTVLSPSLFAARSKNVLVKDVIWEMNFLLADYSAGVKNHGFFAYDANYTTNGSDELENVFMISTTVTHVAHSDKNYVWYAANDTALKNSEASTYSKQYQYAKGTVHRFESASAMANDAEYGATKVGNWSVSASGIVWVD